MGIKGLRPPGTGPNRFDQRSAKHRKGISGGARGVVTGCIVNRRGVPEYMRPLTTQELRGLVLHGK